MVARGQTRFGTATGRTRGSRAISDAPPPRAARPRRSVVSRLRGRALVGGLLIGAIAAAIVLSDLDAYWPLDLKQRPGPFTQARLRLLSEQPETCRRVLARSGVTAIEVQPIRREAQSCGFEDGVALAGGALDATPVMRCGAAAAYATWVRHVVQPAAERTFGERVVGVRNLGTFSCRDIAGRPGRRSQHASANAIDVSGFDLASGRRITVMSGWRQIGPEGNFLREVRDGACGLFAGVLSPDWNAAHRDHLHLDMGRLDFCR